VPASAASDDVSERADARGCCRDSGRLHLGSRCAAAAEDDGGDGDGDGEGDAVVASDAATGEINAIAEPGAGDSAGEGAAGVGDFGEAAAPLATADGDDSGTVSVDFEADGGRTGLVLRAADAGEAAGAAPTVVAAATASFGVAATVPATVAVATGVPAAAGGVVGSGLAGADAGGSCTRACESLAAGVMAAAFATIAEGLFSPKNAAPRAPAPAAAPATGVGAISRGGAPAGPNAGRSESVAADRHGR
jgi:hypothetical protein